MNDGACPICKNDGVQIIGRYPNVDSNRCLCEVCGAFALSGPAWYELLVLDDKHRIKLSAFTRERTVHNREEIMLVSQSTPSQAQQIPIPTVSIEDVINQFPQKLSDRLDRALLNLSCLSEYAGSIFPIEKKDCPLLYPDTFETMGYHFMLQQLQLLSYIEQYDNKYRITATGWNRIYELESSRPNSVQGFIAMAFSSEYDPIWQAIEQAIHKAGFKPFRVNQSDTNEKICDEIIAQIQRSKFIVADFTGQRNGVYFEAGYAMGLGIPVIWSCSAQEIRENKLHFDTRQYNHIDWETPEELSKRLYNRIRATIH